jgi:hypothetical protein
MQTRENNLIVFAAMAFHATVVPIFWQNLHAAVVSDAAFHAALDG